MNEYEVEHTEECKARIDDVTKDSYGCAECRDAWAYGDYYEHTGECCVGWSNCG